MNPQELALELQPRAVRLGVVRSELNGVGSQLNASRKDKNRGLKRHKENFLWIARGAESFFELAGEHELAKRIRPSIRRKGRRAAEVEEKTRFKLSRFGFINSVVNGIIDLGI